ncbi:MAG: hypothetical protein ACXQT4_06760 [Methanotrichaceae archaeon]
MAKAPENRLRIVVRSNTNKNHIYIKGNKPVTLRFMLGFDISRVSEPETEHPDPKIDPEIWTGPKDRWVFQLDDDYWIWDWAKKDCNIRSSNVYRLYQQISEELSRGSSNTPKERSDEIFDLELENQNDKVVLEHIAKQENKIIPIIYQPAVDCMKNFVREVHCAQSKQANWVYEVEVMIIFNNEQLRKHAYFNKIYEEIRRQLYDRTLDIETFKIRIDTKNPSNNKFIFENIYSNGHDLVNDSIHGDKPSGNPPKEHNIRYYFANHNHPIVFINTSNHAMAEHDSNHRLWKWEYIPGVKDAPIIFGKKTRKEIDKEFS